VVIGYTPEQFRQHIGAERLTDLIRHGERTDDNTLQMPRSRHTEVT